jgi:hypothetical protein
MQKTLGNVDLRCNESIEVEKGRLMLNMLAWLDLGNHNREMSTCCVVMRRLTLEKHRNALSLAMCVDMCRKYLVLILIS